MSGGMFTRHVNKRRLTYQNVEELSCANLFGQEGKCAKYCRFGAKVFAIPSSLSARYPRFMTLVNWEIGIFKIEDIYPCL